MFGLETFVSGWDWALSGTNKFARKKRFQQSKGIAITP
jgi:hypothetical protein